MNLMNLVKIGCSEVSVHLDMFITNHVYIHRRLSSETTIKGTTESNVRRTVMDRNNYQQRHRVVLNNQHQLTQVNDDPDNVVLADDHIDQAAIEEIADRIKELGDQFLRERQNAAQTPALRLTTAMEKYIPRLVIGGFAVYTIYKCAHK